MRKIQLFKDRRVIHTLSGDIYEVRYIVEGKTPGSMELRTKTFTETYKINVYFGRLRDCKNVRVEGEKQKPRCKKRCFTKRHSEVIWESNNKKKKIKAFHRFYYCLQCRAYHFTSKKLYGNFNSL